MIATSLRAFIGLGTNILAGTFGSGAFLSSDNGATWQPFADLNARGIRALTRSDSAIFAGTSTDGLQKSTDGGSTWFPIMTSVRDSYIQTTEARGNTVLAATFSHGVYRSTDNGSSWTPVGPSLQDPDVAGFTFIDSTVFAATLTAGFIFRSTDDGVTWIPSGNGLTTHSSTQKVLPLGSDLFAAVNDGVYRSTNHGASWSLAVNGMSHTFILSLAINGNTLFAGTGDGFVYRSTDHGNQWVQVSDGLPLIGSTSAVFAISFNGPNALLGTYSTGVWWRPASEILSSVTDQHTAPASYELEQNYPNPFNPTTTIRFSLPSQSPVKAEGRAGEGSFVSLKVYDMLGREVATLVNEDLKPGRYERTFDGSGLASGVYYYRIQAGSFVASRKVLLLK